MNKKMLLLMLLMTIIFINKVAYAKSSYYVKSAIGTGISEKLNQQDYNKKRIKNNRIISFGIGKEIGNNIDLDVTANFVNKLYFKHRVYSPSSALHGRLAMQKFSSKALLLNGTYNFTTSFLIDPYLSAGMGVAKNKASDYAIFNFATQKKAMQLGKRVHSFTYTFAGGIKYKMQLFELLLEYRHLDLGKFSTKRETLATFLDDGSIIKLSADAPIKARIKCNTINIGIKVLF